jgi:hypothetical protein
MEGARVSVRDVRGGVTVSRRVESDTAEGDVRVLMPLPLVAESELPEAAWPVEVRVGEHGSFERVEVARATQAQGGQFRVAVVGDDASATVALAGFSQLPVATATVPASEALSGPPLVFAGFDAVLIPEAVAAEMDEERVLAITTAGVRVIVSGNVPHVLGRLGWKRVGEKGSLWIFPEVALPTVPVLEPGLESSRVLQVEASPSGTVLVTLAMVPLGAVGVVVLARGLFRPPWGVVVGCLLGLMGLTVGAIFLLRSDAPPEQRVVAWRSFSGDSANKGKRQLSERERVCVETTLFARTFYAAADEGTVLVPVSPNARSYFGTDVSLKLSGENGSAGMTCSTRLPARGGWAYLERSASLAFPETGEQWLIDGGYVEAAREGGRELLTTFADRAATAAIRNSLLAWYDLRFEASHHYVLRSSLKNSEEMEVSDLGAGSVASP